MGMRELSKAELNTILLVEDDKVMRSLLRDTLEADDLLILEAAKGSRALEILQSHEIHLILLDLNLPDICGIELIGRIKGQTPVPLVVVSGDEG